MTDASPPPTPESTGAATKNTTRVRRISNPMIKKARKIVKAKTARHIAPHQAEESYPLVPPSETELQQEAMAHVKEDAGAVPVESMTSEEPVFNEPNREAPPQAEHSKPSQEIQEAFAETNDGGDDDGEDEEEGSQDQDWPEPEPATSGQQGASESSKRNKRRRKKNKSGQGQQMQAVPSPETGELPQIAAVLETQETPAGTAPTHHQRPQAPPAPQRNRPDPELLAKHAWKIYLAEVSEEGVALIGDLDARDLTKRCFRLAEIFLEEQSRRR